jgi:hypothetical protein
MKKLDQIVSAVYNLGEINKLKDAFHEVLDRLNTKEPAIPSEIKGSPEALSVTCLGYTVVAKPRAVVGPDTFFHVEYSFEHHVNDDEPLPIWRCYLTYNERREPELVLRLSGKGTDRLCDANNVGARGYIVERIASALLESPLFEPTKDGTIDEKFS